MARSTFSKAAPVFENSGKALGVLSRVPPVQIRLPGNQALLRLQQNQQSLGVSTKVVVGEPNGRDEQEADRVAEQVMQIREPKLKSTRANPEEVTPQYRSQSDDVECEGGCSETSVSNSESDQLKVPPIVHDVLRADGSPMKEDIRRFMEPRFGQDFSRVRIHADEKSASSARAVHARAYTVGQNIVFGTGELSTHEQGMRLIAHELAHVVQQEQGAIRLQRVPEEQRAGAPFQAEARGEGSDIMEDPTVGIGSLLCTALDDNAVIMLIRDYFYLRYPRAYDHIIHYLSGVGGTFDEDIETLFRENPRAVERVASKIRAAGTHTGTYVGADTTTAPIRQSDYDNEDWRLSLGNVDQISWEILGDPDSNGYALMRITLRDPYHWSIHDERNTDCIHEVMERQKQDHAAEFISIGVGDVRLRVTESAPIRP